MSLRAYLWGIRLFSLLALAACAGIVFSVDPNEAGVPGRVLLFLGMLAFLVGALNLFVIGTYRHMLGEARAAHHIASAARQGLILALFAWMLIVFRFLQMLTWWDAALLFAVALIVELTFRRRVKMEE